MPSLRDSLWVFLHYLLTYTTPNGVIVAETMGKILTQARRTTFFTCKNGILFLTP